MTIEPICIQRYLVQISAWAQHNAKQYGRCRTSIRPTIPIYECASLANFCILCVRIVCCSVGLFHCSCCSCCCCCGVPFHWSSSFIRIVCSTNQKERRRRKYPLHAHVNHPIVLLFRFLVFVCLLSWVSMWCEPFVLYAFVYGEIEQKKNV